MEVGPGRDGSSTSPGVKRHRIFKGTEAKERRVKSAPNNRINTGDSCGARWAGRFLEQSRHASAYVTKVEEQKRTL